MNSSIQRETPVTVGAKVNCNEAVQRIEEQDESRTVNDNDDDSPQHMISKLTTKQLNDTFIHLLQNNIKKEHKQHFRVVGGRLEAFGVHEDVKVTFDGAQCVETTLTAAKKSVHRGKQLARITKGVIGWKNHNVLVYHIPARVYHGIPLDGQECSHICGNQNCVNPGHLEWVIRPLNVSRYSCSLAAKAAKRAGLDKPSICFHSPVCEDCTSCANADAIRSEIVANFNREQQQQEQTTATTSSTLGKRKASSDEINRVVGGGISFSLCQFGSSGKHCTVVVD